MKGKHWILLVLLALLNCSCITSRYGFNASQLQKIQLGMNLAEVKSILGEPNYRNLNKESEEWEFRALGTTGWSVVKIKFEGDKLVKMKSYLDDDSYLERRHQDCEEKEEEKSSDKESTSKVWVTSDGKHIVQSGNMFVMPDGTHETVIKAGKGLIITGSGQHIVAY